MAGRDRKNSLKALFGGDGLLPQGNAAAPEIKSRPEAQSDIPHDGAPASNRASSGAIKAMGLSLSSITREAEEAKALRQALEEGERVVALETDKIDTSFVSDRLSDEERDDPDFLALVDSVRDNGQQVPVLVRPHPDSHGRYQVAYGHRRLKAAKRLGLPIKAIVKALSDDELVLAQGKENAERRNLSFIERALFANALVDRGFDRKVIGDALAVQKSELSRLLQVVDSVPVQYVRAIGPAPKAGRERWMALGQLFATGGGAAIEKAIDEVHSEKFKSADSDKRFQMLFERLDRSRRRPDARIEELTGPDGKVFARINRKGKGVKIEFQAGIAEDFIAQLAGRLNQDYAAFLKAGK